MHFGWKSGSRHKVDPQIAGERIEALREQHGGSITPEHVVEDARSDASPLHPEFEWRDDVAAEGYRRVQAGALLRSLVVIHEKNETPVRQYVVVETAASDDPDDLHATRAYVGVEDALRDPAMRAQVLGRALDEMRAFQRRYAALDELAGVLGAIDKALQEGEEKPKKRRSAA